MKKIFTMLVFIFVLAVKIFSVEFSIGANIGSILEQNIENSTTTIVGLPEFGLKADVRFEKFGLKLDFDFCWININTFTTSNSVFYEMTQKGGGEILLLTPYIPIQFGRFSIAVGPSIGFYFAQTNINIKNQKYDTSANAFAFILGGDIDVRYPITEKLKLCLDIPILAKPYTKIMDARSSGRKQDVPDGSWNVSNVFSIPALSIIYTF